MDLPPHLHLAPEEVDITNLESRGLAEPKAGIGAYGAMQRVSWRRDAEPGLLGPHDVAEWLVFAHSGGPIGCHQTIRQDDD